MKIDINSFDELIKIYKIPEINNKEVAERIKTLIKKAQVIYISYLILTITTWYISQNIQFLLSIYCAEILCIYVIEKNKKDKIEILMNMLDFNMTIPYINAAITQITKEKEYTKELYSTLNNYLAKKDYRTLEAIVPEMCKKCPIFLKNKDKEYPMEDCKIIDCIRKLK